MVKLFSRLIGDAARGWPKSPEKPIGGDLVCISAMRH